MFKHRKNDLKHEKNVFWAQEKVHVQVCWHNLSKPSQFLCISDGARPLLLQMTSQHQIIIRWAIHHPMSQHPIIVRWAIHHFFTASGWHWETCSKMKCPKTMKLALNGVQVAPFGLKLCQNDAPDLRIILEALLCPKTLFKIKKKHNSIKIPSFTVKN